MKFKYLIPLALLAACAEFPALDRVDVTSAERAPYPAIIPLGPVLAGLDQTSGQSPLTPEFAASLTARLRALQARAARLRGPVIDGTTRARMRAGVNSTALQ
ncbi:hypothetical protein [Marivivens marinus]|uniref:hypothetical protein n=1 Tax=Marivivens marinus TaxID=3110173 RepID=UPI003B846A49